MKHTNLAQLEQLERVLVQARLHRKPLHLSSGWVQAVMQDIRRLRMEHTSPQEMRWLLWRTAAVVAMATSALIGLSLLWHAGSADADRFTFLAEAFEESSFFIVGAP